MTESCLKEKGRYQVVALMSDERREECLGTEA